VGLQNKYGPYTVLKYAANMGTRLFSLF